MMRTWKLAGRAAVVTLAVVLVGCGGTGTNNEQGVGSVGITVAWPQLPEGVQPQLIPAASNSIKVEVLRDDSTLAEQTVTINRPETHARIDDVRAGDALLRATAYPQPGAEGVAQATAETNITVVADEYHEWPLTLASTIDHVDVQPSAASIDVADTLQLAATAKNADGQTVLVPADAPFDWSVTGGGGQVSVDEGGLVTGTSVGQGSVSAQEGESGVAGTADVTVNAPDVIVFATWRELDCEVYRMKLDGSQVTNLTGNPAFDAHPDWSPDGAQIAFVSGRSGPRRIHAMNADGSNVRQVTDVWEWNCFPAWSPDGARIAFEATPESMGEGNHEVWVANADGTSPVRLTETAADIEDGGPSWSPDGARIAYHSGAGADFEIWTMNPDGSNKTMIVGSQGADSYARWSPDGSRIAFCSDRDGNREVYVCNPDGSGQTRLTDEPASWDSPGDWSPDSSEILFHSDRSGNWDLYVMNANGTNVRQLTDDPADDLGESWTVWTALPW